MRLLMVKKYGEPKVRPYQKIFPFSAFTDH